MANQKITDVATANSLSDSDLLFVNSGGSLKQVTKANSGMVTMDLLWENAAPTSTFATQTISLDLSGYDRIRIDHRGSNSSAYRGVVEFDVGASFTMLTVGSSSSKIWAGYRNGTTSTTSVTFYGAFSVTPSSSGQSDAYIIPLKIYGIKGVQ